MSRKSPSRMPRARHTLALVLLLTLFCCGALIFSATRSSEANNKIPISGSLPLVQPRDNPSRPPEKDVRGIHGVPRGTGLRTPTQAQL